MRRLTQLEYISKFKQIHNDFYSYEDFPVEYNQKTDIQIICPIHGYFVQRIINHSNGMGCPKCGINKRTNTKHSNTEKKYKIKLIKKYKNQFDFSKADFKNGIDSKIKTKCFSCDKYFYPRMLDLIKDNHHCPHCRTKNMKNGYYKDLFLKMQNKFINEANEIYNNFYDYSEVEYKNSFTPVKILCPTHGAFYKRPADHVYKHKLQGCPFCTAELNKSSHEEKVYQLLTKKGIPFIFNYYEKSNVYLKNKPFDFYISKYNLLIEVDGDQHRKRSWNQPEKDFQTRLKTDNKKRSTAKEMGYEVLVLETHKLYLSQLEEYLTKFNDYPNGQ